MLPLGRRDDDVYSGKPLMAQLAARGRTRMQSNKFGGPRHGGGSSFPVKKIGVIVGVVGVVAFVLYLLTGLFATSSSMPSSYPPPPTASKQTSYGSAADRNLGGAAQAEVIRRERERCDNDKSALQDELYNIRKELQEWRSGVRVNEEVLKQREQQLIDERQKQLHDQSRDHEMQRAQMQANHLEELRRVRAMHDALQQNHHETRTKLGEYELMLKEFHAKQRDEGMQQSVDDDNAFCEAHVTTLERMLNDATQTLRICNSRLEQLGGHPLKIGDNIELPSREDVKQLEMRRPSTASPDSRHYGDRDHKGNDQFGRSDDDVQQGLADAHREVRNNDNDNASNNNGNASPGASKTVGYEEYAQYERQLNEQFERLQKRERELREQQQQQQRQQDSTASSNSYNGNNHGYAGAYGY